ncbi:hypothetical protein L202_01446 [Cryptococcus amylolentus CBS 6039]|uniref:Ribosomal RNA-processing protein 17 n=2 Tax=Cryptococcus amylolentus TaxID=104669 RepID=A0A1E3I3S0_9TREE|nr:hypothetical protein L202_01446 [Cryptococcus amylolentus CBS 6039]ODN83274.1 hypothetical protein L202_01446 [Cryptococcus amylolentus CBS 6039]ODO10832.1 hypothetical protein I350_01431 [Cryptococcus amylolentus CBS 6273]
MAPASKQKSNVALLTEGASYIQRAKKARKDQVEEIKFDDEARREWLTGFSKRKKAKVEEKRSRAKEREKQEHLDERKKARKELRERAAANVKSVRQAMGLVDESEDEDENNEAGPSSAPVDEEEEFSDDDQIATVTITEDFDPTTTSSFIPTRSSQSPAPEQVEAPAPEVKKVKMLPPSSKRAQKALDKKKAQSKDGKKVGRTTSMETKAERRKGKEIESRKRGKKAALAMERRGGKTSSTRGKPKGKGRR